MSTPDEIVDISDCSACDILGSIPIMTPYRDGLSISQIGDGDAIMIVGYALESLPERPRSTGRVVWLRREPDGWLAEQSETRPSPAGVRVNHKVRGVSRVPSIGALFTLVQWAKGSR